jgi:hypothetical protein
MPLKSYAVDCSVAAGAWAPGGQATDKRTYLGRMYQNCACNGWDGAGHNPLVNAHWTDLGACSVNPELTTDAASSIVGNTATLEGEVTADAGSAITAMGFLYYTVEGDVNAATIGAPGSCTTVTHATPAVAPYIYAIASLSISTTYYFKAYATNGNGTEYGATLSFTTLDGKPTLTTDAVTGAGGNSMTLNGTINTNSGFALSDRGFLYGTTSADVTSATLATPLTATTVSEGGTSVAAYNKALTGLSCPGTTYYIKAYATNANGTAYGANVSKATTSPGTYTSVQDGAWTASATWGGCVPSTSVANTINIGHAVTKTGLTIAGGADITVTTGGVLTNTGTISMGSGGTNLTVDVGGTVVTTDVTYTTNGVITSNGTFTITNNFNVQSNGTATFNGTATVGGNATASGPGDFDITGGTFAVTGNLDCSSDGNFTGDGAITVGGDWQVWGSGGATIGGSVDVSGEMSVKNNGYIVGTGVIGWVTKDINPANSGAYAGCVDGTKYDDNAGTAAWAVPPANPWDLTTCAAATLPVELISFSASKVSGLLNVNWVTGSEINSDYFEVLGSVNGVTWEVIQMVAGAGNSNDVNEYEVIEDQANTVLLKYVRLKQVDLDGKEVLFWIVALESSIDKLDISVFPNPANNVLHVGVSELEKGKYKILIVNAQGQTVENMNVFIKDGANSFNLLIAGLNNGLYIVVFVNSNEKRFSKRFIKN